MSKVMQLGSNVTHVLLTARLNNVKAINEKSNNILFVTIIRRLKFMYCHLCHYNYCRFDFCELLNKQ